MTGKALNIGIMPRHDYAKRTIAIAKGKYRPQADEPKVWFESVKSMAQVLSDENQALTDLIIRHRPQSLSEPERISKRKTSA
ncbi:MAG: hypothetical protein R3F02_04030 [Thiolinea sp.]